MIRPIFACVLALGVISGAAYAQPAAAQPSKPSGEQSPAQDRWLVSDQSIAFAPAAVAFPRRAGVLEAGRHSELSNPGEGIDNGIQYRSADGRTIGTVYIYHPGLAHAGLSAWATENAIRLNSESRVEARGSRVVAAGDAPGVAIRSDYANYRNGNASSAAFVKAGRWMVKLRVTGPDGSAVAAAMDALLAGVRWGVSNRPQPAAALAVRDCAGDEGRRAARGVADPRLEQLAAIGLVTTFDGGGFATTDESGSHRDLPSRVPAELCLSSRIPIAGGDIPILRDPAGEPRSSEFRTRLVAVLSDSGDLLEVLDASNLGQYVVLAHSMGQTAMLGSFDGVPSDAQIGDIINGRDREAGRFRVIARFRPGQSVQVQVVRPPEPPARPVT